MAEDSLFVLFPLKITQKEIIKVRHIHVLLLN